MANSEEPDKTPHNLRRLILVYTVCSILILRIITVGICFIGLKSLLFYSFTSYNYCCPYILTFTKKGKRKVQGVPQSQTVALPRPQEEEETDKSKQAQIEQNDEKH